MAETELGDNRICDAPHDPAGQGPVPLAGMTNILVVDDNELDHAICARALRKGGFTNQIHAFLNSRKALDFLLGGDAPRFDIALLDLNMPLLSGVELMEQVSDVLGPVEGPPMLLMLGAVPPLALLERARATSCYAGALKKPVSRDCLLRTLADLELGR